jgi:hypothetical protein
MGAWKPLKKQCCFGNLWGGSGGGGALNRRLLLHNLEKINYLNNVVDIVNSDEFEGVLEFFFVLYLEALYCGKVQKKGKIRGLWACPFDSFICSARQRLRLIIMFSQGV